MYLALAVVVITATGLLLVRQGTAPNESALESPAPSANEPAAPLTPAAAARAIAAAAPAQATTASSPPPSPAAPLPFHPSELLLRARAGSFTPAEVAEAVAAFAQQTPEALAELDRLATSAEPVERILGLYLRLEIDGPSAALLSAAASDPSPWVAAQAAEWLYFHADFDRWRNYLTAVAQAWTPAKTAEVLDRFAANPGSSPEVPAGLTILQLGRALPDFVGALLNSAPPLQTDFADALLDPAIPPEARTALLDIFREARPPAYTALTEKLITAYGEDSPARFRAFTHYVTPTGDPATVADWLASAEANAPTGDPLAFRFDQARRLLTENAARLVPLAQTREQVHAALQAAPSLRAISAADQAALARYLEHLITTPPAPEDAAPLERLASLLRAEPHLDYSARRLSARVRHLAAQARP